jgi:GNAT superfamily N-acetyltransferase
MAGMVIEPESLDVPLGLVTRRATEADLGRAVELLALGAVPGTVSAEDPSDLTPYRAALRALQDASGAVLVAELEGEVVGLCQLIVFRHLQGRGGLCAELESVHVHPDHRGRGIGSVLVRDAVARARAVGCYRVQLTSNRARPEAHRFYERLGFVPSHVGFKLPLR